MNVSTRRIASETAIDFAITARERGRIDQAVDALRRAIQHDRQNARLWQTLGTVYRADEESALAVAAFEQAARLAPLDFKPAYGVAQASLEAGWPAVALFDAARVLAPSEPMLVQGRAAAQMAEGHAAEAVEQLEAIVDANPLWLDGYATHARLLWRNGEPEFDRLLKRGIERQRAYAGLWQLWIETLIQAELYARAETVIARARLQFGETAFLAPLEAIVASELGDIQRANEVFASLPVKSNVMLAERFARHLLRTGRAAEIEELASPWLGQADEGRLWPYLALAWRVLGDPRWHWLEDVGRLISVTQLNMDLVALAEKLRALHRRSWDPLGQSVRSGTQTDGPLFARAEPEIRALRTAVIGAVDEYLSTLGEADVDHPTRRHLGKPFRLAGSWSIRLIGGGHHSQHIHPQGWISSAFYIAVPDSDVAGPAPAGQLEFGRPPPELALDLEPVARVVPVPNQLVLFPSTMWHGTVPIAAGERLTVAFDVVPIG